MRRVIALLIALVAAAGLLTAPPAAANPIGDTIGDGLNAYGRASCNMSFGLAGPVMRSMGKKVPDSKVQKDLCNAVGDKVEKKVKEKVKKAWDAVWDSVIGDVLRSARDTAKTVLKATITFGLAGPSVDLKKTGLFGEGADMQGMMIWLGWVIAAFALMWQLGKMAVTGQGKHLGRAVAGFAENAFITGIGVSVIGTLLEAGDAMTTGVINMTFGDDGVALDRIVTVMLPAIGNPMTMAGILFVMLAVGLIQMVLIFLRQSAIPIQALLLPIAGAGRMGGEATRQWAPKLITSILVVIAYKPILAIIMCVGFAEVEKSSSLVEFLRGLATLVLAILAPGPLTKIFEPVGARVGGAMGAGGAVAAAGAVADRFRGRDKSGGDAAAPALHSAVEQQKYVEQSMPKTYRGTSGADGDSGENGQSSDAVAQAARNARKQPGTSGAEGGQGASGTPGASGGLDAPGGPGGAGGGAAARGGGRAAAGAGAGLQLEVLDGVHQTTQQASTTIGDGGSST